MPARDLTAARLREVLTYSPESGLFTRLQQTSNAAPLSMPVGAPTSAGYIAISVDGVRYKAHRLAWLFMTGHWPVGEGDHINGDRADNRWANLRDATPSENQHNRRARRGSACGLLGVARSGTASKPWRAQIKPPGQKVRYLGIFATPEEAHAAYLEAKKLLHPTSPK